MSRIRKDTEAPEWVEPPAEKLLPLHKPFPERTWQRSQPTDQCEEPDCTKTVAEHIAECMEAIRHMRERNEAVKP